MELLILKDEQIIARTTLETLESIDHFRLEAFAGLPEYPEEKPPKGMMYDLKYIDGELSWALIDRPLSLEERVEAIEQEQHAWKIGATVAVGDRVYFNGFWYTCTIAHTTQADWTPDVAVSLWTPD